MPKPVKHGKKTGGTPPKPRRPSDPNRAAHSILVEHLSRAQEAQSPENPSDAPAPQDDFEAWYRARMAALGAKGGKKSGAKRMENLSARRRKAIAKAAAAARWGKKP